MTDEALVADPPPSVRRRARMRLALRTPEHWRQLVRFGAVGASGYAVNLLVFKLLVHGAAVSYPLAAVAAFAVALVNNFLWNRVWTFRAGDGHAGFQAARFVVVSLTAFGVQFALLLGMVEFAGIDKVAAQAIAIACATPLNFLGNKLWSFRT